MKLSSFGLLFLTSLAAYGQVTSPFTVYVHDTTGTLPDAFLSTAYQLASTPIGGVTSTVLKMVNTSPDTVYILGAVVSTAADSSTANPNFSVSGLGQDQNVGPGGSVLFTVNFAPTTVGLTFGLLNVSVQIQQNGCSFTGSSNICPVYTSNISTLTGSAIPAQVVLSYQSDGGPVILTPSSSSPVNFPNTSVGAASTFAFTLTNPTSVDELAPAVSLPITNQNAASVFTLDTSGVPAAIAAGQSANFTVTFTPSQSGLMSGVLQVGSTSYPIDGAGIIVADIDSLQIWYTDSAGIRTLPQSGTSISFGKVVAGSGEKVVLIFNIVNPAASANSVSVPAVSISGAAFSLSGVPTAPIVISPGDSIAFQATFTPQSSGSYTGGLSIASRQFSLTGVSVIEAIQGLSLTLGAPLSSEQQASLTVQLSAPSPVSAVGTITMDFTPSVANVADDPAIVFLLTGGRQLPITLDSGSQTAQYNGQSNIAFQTGTTAGIITFSVAFTSAATYAQSFTIPPAPIQLAPAQASRQSAHLLVRIDGYDNTYTTGPLSFTFYDMTGNAIGSPIQLNAASNFQQLFFTNNSTGGVFSLEASFPVTGDVDSVGSVAVGVTNTLSQSTSVATFH